MRSKGRSALVAAMVGVPLLLIAGGLILVQTIGDVSQEERALQSLGATDAKVMPQGRTPVVQDFAAVSVWTESDESGAPWTKAEVEAALPEELAARVLTLSTGNTLVTTDIGAVSADVREFDIRDPEFEGLARIISGRAPVNATEVLVSEDLAGRGFGPGGTIRVGQPERPLRVVGVIRNPAQFDGNQLVGMPGAVLGPGAGQTYLVDTDGVPVTWEQVGELNELGLAVASRAVLTNPPPDDQLSPKMAVGSDPAQQMFYALVVACIVLEVVLLAGPAFAVGARRQRRQFALLAAVGGTPKHIRRVMLAQGALLGLLSGVTGVVIAFGVLLAGRPLVEELVGAEIGAYDVRPLDLALLIAVAMLAAFLAAFVPARQAARQDTVAALGGRGVVRTRRGWPLIGLLAVGAGLAVALPAAGGAGGEKQVVLGTFGLVAGTIMLTPAVLGLIGRIGSRLPLSLRLAARDTARQRSRGTSAVAAIMGTVLGITALGIASSSDFAEGRRDYAPEAPMGTLQITYFYTGEEVPEERFTELAESVEELLPGRDALVLSAARDGLTKILEPGCRAASEPCQPYIPDSLQNQQTQTYGSTGQAVLVADIPTVQAALGVTLTKRQQETLSNGGVLVPDEAALDESGRALVGTDDGRESEEIFKMPGAALPGLLVVADDYTTLMNEMVMTAETAQQLGLHVAPDSIVAPSGGPEISEEQQAALEKLANGLLPHAFVYVERGFTDSYTPILAILAGLGTLILLVGIGTATALSLADARADFATLAAVGASARVRRRQAMAQAGVIGFVGAVLGVVAGAVPGLAITFPLTAPSPGGHIVDVPWSLLGLLVLGVPLLAVLGAGLFTRSRLPLVRRLA